MGTILVVHDELNSLELSVFKKDDRSKPELRYFPLFRKLTQADMSDLQLSSAPLSDALEQHTLCRCLVYWCFGETRRVTWVSNSVSLYDILDYLKTNTTGVGTS